MTRLPSLASYSRLGRSSQAFPLTQDDEESLVRQAGRRAVGGISAVANVLDLPGSAVRDIAAGENPFDQFLPWNWTSSQNRVTGRQLLQRHGLAGPRKTWGNFGAGLAAEIALDPLTYMTFGGSALTKAGKVAKAAGLMGEVPQIAARKAGVQLGKIGPRQARIGTTLEDLVQAIPGAREAAERAAGAPLTQEILRQPLGGMFGFGLPGMQLAPRVGTGARAQQAGKAFDIAGRAAYRARVPGTQFRPFVEIHRLFDSKIGEARTSLGQSAARRRFAAHEAARSWAREKIAQYTSRLVATGQASPDKASFIRQVMELPDIRNNPALTPNDLKVLADDINKVLADIPDQAADFGLRLNKLVDPEIDYFPRFISESLQVLTGKKSRLFSSFDPASKKRLGFLRGDDVTGTIKGGTETIRRIAQDADINRIIDTGGTVADIEQVINTKYAALVPEKYLKKTTGGLKRSNRRRALARWLPRLSKETREAGVFGNHPLMDLQARLVAAGDSLASARIVLETLAEPGVLKAAVPAARVEGSVTLRQLLSNANMQAGDGTSGAVAKLDEIMGGSLGGIKQVAMADPDAAKALVRDALQMRVDGELAEDLSRFLKGFDSPEPANAIMQVADSVLNVTKAFFTTPWPAFHTRNLFSGQFNNFTAGMLSPQSVKDAHVLMTGGVIEGAADIPVIQAMAQQRGMQQLDDQAATQLLGELAYAHNVTGRFAGEASAVTGKVQAGGGIDDLLAEMMAPGRKQVSAGTVARRAIGREPGTQITRPWELRGVGGRAESSFGPVAAGQDIGHYIEGLNRISPFIKQLREGISPDRAASKVGAAQVQYANRYYTKFEQQALMRMFPFYKFSSRMMPYTLRLLSEKPGGRLAQSLRAINRSRSPDELTPDYVAETASVPLAGTPLESVLGAPKQEGTRRYLTGLGLMFEDPLSFFGGGPQGAALEVGSRLNPLVKFPLEMATGQSFFQKGPMGGRRLEDMDPTIGRTLANVMDRERPVDLPGFLEHAIANSPLARASTTARTLTDPRKSLPARLVNVGTGFRISDVSPGAQDAILRERAQQLMREMGAKTFAKTYFPTEEVERMSPEEATRALQFQALMTVLARRAKQRRQASSQ